MTALQRKKKGQKQNVTRGSRVIPQRSTNRAQPSLSSVIGREPELSGWYERSMTVMELLGDYISELILFPVKVERGEQKLCVPFSLSLFSHPSVRLFILLPPRAFSPFSW